MRRERESRSRAARVKRPSRPRKKGETVVRGGDRQEYGTAPLYAPRRGGRGWRRRRMDEEKENGTAWLGSLSEHMYPTPRCRPAHRSMPIPHLCPLLLLHRISQRRASLLSGLNLACSCCPPSLRWRACWTPSCRTPTRSDVEVGPSLIPTLQ